MNRYTRRNSRRALARISAILFAFGCGDSTAPPTDTNGGPPVAYIVATSTFQPVVGSNVLIFAQLTDAQHNVSRTAGRVVTWSSTGTGGSFSSPTSTTGPEGLATVTFTVGPIVGAYAVSATDDKHAAGVSPMFQSIPGALAKYILGASVADPPAGADIVVLAQASDANGNSVQAVGQVVTWTKTGSGGLFSSPTTVTDGSGLAGVTFTTAAVAGATYTISAKDAGGVGGTSGNVTTLPQLSLASIATGVGTRSSCGIASDGKAWCWGANDGGALGNGTTLDRSLPGMVAGNLSLTSLSAGFAHVCGVTTGGVAVCWGNNAAGELGDNTNTSRSLPAAIASTLTFTSVTAGDSHTCGLVTGGNVYCWGATATGRLGDGGLATSGTKPVKVAGILTFASISAGAAHTCGVTTSGDAYCWGANASGQLGDNSVVDRSTPALVTGGFKFTSVSAGHDHTCGVVVGGAAYCWGDDFYGQLGSGAPNAGKSTPTLVVGGLSFVAISAGGFHTCGITTTSTAWCWGANSTGELGIDDSRDTSMPTLVEGGLTFRSISAGGAAVFDSYYYYSAGAETHTCGVTTTSVAYCWGSNNRGELGIGTFAPQATAPVKVSGQR